MSVRPTPLGRAAAAGSRPGLDLRALADDYRRAVPPVGVQVAFYVLLAVVVFGPTAQLLSLLLGQPSLGGVVLAPDTPWSVYAYGLLGMVLSAAVGVVVLLEMRVGRAWARSASVVIAAIALVITITGIAQILATSPLPTGAALLNPFTLFQIGQAGFLLLALLLLLHSTARSYHRR